MAKFVSPLLGFNNNVRHKNRVFHIQTEDSGINHPHIITHLFMDGGRILKSVKTSYAEHLGTEKMSETVRQMMKEQHKAMFIALRDGQFDHLVEGGPAKAAKPAPSDAKLEAAKPAEPVVPAAEASDTDATQRLPAQSAEDAAAALEPAPKTEPDGEVAAAAAPASTPPKSGETGETAAKAGSAPPRTATAAMASLPSDGPFRAVASAVPPPVAPGPSPTRLGIAAPAPVSAEAAAKGSPAAGTPAHRSAPPIAREEPESASRTASGPPVAPVAASATTPGSAPPVSKSPSVKDLTLDFDALDRATPETGAPLFRENDLPPPPANLFAKHTSGGYRAVDAQTPRRDPREEPESPGPRPAARPSPHPPRLSGAPRAATPVPPPESGTGPSRETPRAPDQRYAPARPAAIFGASATRPQPASLFSDELISDKSLDEVILSYLAEDLEPPRRK